MRSEEYITEVVALGLALGQSNPERATMPVEANANLVLPKDVMCTSIECTWNPIAVCGRHYSFVVRTGSIKVNKPTSPEVSRRCSGESRKCDEKFCIFSVSVAADDPDKDELHRGGSFAEPYG